MHPVVDDNVAAPVDPCIPQRPFTELDFEGKHHLMKLDIIQELFQYVSKSIYNFVLIKLHSFGRLIFFFFSNTFNIQMRIVYIDPVYYQM